MRRSHRPCELKAPSVPFAQGPFLVPPGNSEDKYVPTAMPMGLGIAGLIVLGYLVWVPFAICCPDDRPLVGRTLATCLSQCEWNYVIVALLLVFPEAFSEILKKFG